MSVPTTYNRIQDVTDRWYLHSPYFAVFLLRFKYYESAEFAAVSVPTMAVTVQRGTPILIYNEEYCSGLTDEELEGILYHEVLHITGLNQERMGKRNATAWNIATDAVNNEDIVKTKIAGRTLTLPEGGVRFKQIEDYGYSGPLMAEPIADFLEQQQQQNSITLSTRGDNSGGSAEQNNESSSGSEGNQQSDDQSGSQASGDDGEGDSPDKQSGSKGGSPQVLQPLDDHSLMDEIAANPEAMETLEQIVKEARDHSWGSHQSGGIIQIDTFHRRKPTVDPRAIIHRHVTNFMFSNRGEYHYTWSRRNRRGLPIPGKRRAEDEVLVFLDVSGSTFNQATLRKFFNEIDYLASRGVNIRLLTFDVQIREEVRYRQQLWQSRKFKGGGGTFAQPIFNWLHQKGKVNYPTLIFTDGVFEWAGLQSYGAQPFWVFSEDPTEEFFGTPNGKLPFGKSVVLEEEQ